MAGSRSHHSHGSSSKDDKKSKKTQVWYCCHCTYGPLNKTLDAYCSYPECGHKRCKECTVESIKQPKS
ncbi:hypothetical protein PspLS_08008 [Pyricularia sp. CBS 133598]|nr:hypothetical protein PspLS_08008 [Pyricularia sp. CBS 133598]